MDVAGIAGRFGLGGAAVLSDGPVARGKQGAVWQLGTSEGRWAVKVSFGPVTEEDVRTSTGFQEAAYDAGVPTPRVCRTVDGTVLAEVGGSTVRVHAWVDLLPPDPMADPVLVGEVLARLHQVDAPVEGRPDPWHQEPVGAARWDALVVRLQEAGAPFAHRLAGLRDELVALETWIEPPQDVRACHRDLWADNLLPTPDGGVCVVDWENSGPADPAQELGYVAFEFARTDPHRLRALLAGYRSAGGPARLDHRGHFSMLIAQLGHITETASRDWLEPNDRSPSRAAAEAWVSEVFDDPHTRRVLDAMLLTARAV